MELKDIQANGYYYAMPLAEEVAGVIRASVSMTGMQVLSHLSDAEVINLWQYALRQAEDLSRLNVERGMAEIRYPHLWARKCLFRVYSEWRQQEEDAKQLLNTLNTVPQPVSHSTKDKRVPVIAPARTLEEMQASLSRQYQLPPINKL